MMILFHGQGVFFRGLNNCLEHGTTPKFWFSHLLFLLGCCEEGKTEGSGDLFAV